MVEGLPYPDHFHVSAAQGWIGLGNTDEALAELERVSAASLDHVAVLESRFMAQAQGKRLGDALATAERQIVTHPDEAQGWINRGNALFWLGRYEEARQGVLAVLDQFPEHWSLRYNLACYCIKLGTLDDAKRWYEAAAQTADPAELTALALRDPDMEELRDWVRARPLKKPGR